MSKDSEFFSGLSDLSVGFRRMSLRLTGRLQFFKNPRPWPGIRCNEAELDISLMFPLDKKKFMTVFQFIFNN